MIKLAAILLCLTVAIPAYASDEEERRIKRVVDKGCGWLVKQQKDSGSFGKDGPEFACTGLGIIALLSAGHTSDAGPHAAALTKAVDFLVRELPDDGFYGKRDKSRMYGQGIVTLALAEAYGVERDAKRRAGIVATLKKTSAVILAAQKIKKRNAVFAGGWRYEPDSNDADLSLSGFSALALRACRNIGMPIPQQSATDAVAFVLRCYKDRGFAYQPGQAASLAPTAVAMLNLYLLDDKPRDELRGARDYLMKATIGERTRFPYYATYYLAQAAHQDGGELWRRSWPAVQKFLLPRQERDGGWRRSKTGEEPGRVYATSMAILALSVPREALPTYQR